jgi:hypothetical protein
MSSMVEAAAPAYTEDESGFEVIDCWTLIHAPTFLFLLL